MIPVFLLLASAVGLILTDKKEKANKENTFEILPVKNFPLKTPSTLSMISPTNAALMQSKELLDILKVNTQKSVDLYNNLLRQQEELRSQLGTEFED